MYISWLYLLVIAFLSSVLGDTEVVQVDQGCDCGYHGNCTLVENKKHCICDDGFAEMAGNCEALHSPKVTVLNVGESSITFGIRLNDKPDEIKINSYIVEFGLDTDNVEVHEWNETETANNFTLQDLEPSSQYWFRFQAMSSIGNSEWTEWLEYRLDNSSRAPNRPEIYSPKNFSAVSWRKISVRWYAPDENDYGVLYYRLRLYQKNYRGVWENYNEYSQYHQNDTYYYYHLYENLEPSSNYSTQVTAINFYGESDVSVVFFKTDTDSAKEVVVRSYSIVIYVAIAVAGITVLGCLIGCCVHIARRKKS